MARLVISVVGATIGYTIGGPVGAQIGWSIGSAAGNVLFPTEGPNVRQEGPRLGDLKVIGSTYGTPIPRGWGAFRVAGNMIWSTPIIETRHETTTESGGDKGGGGGGGSVTQISYTYAQSFAVAIHDTEIIGVRKIWANGELIYNVSSDADIDTLVASLGNAASITFYTGSESQTANSLIQASVGAADTPAYRGTAYVVFESLQLADFGNRTPNLEFEVVVGGTTTELAVVNTDIGSTAYTWASCAYGNGKWVALADGAAIGSKLPCAVAQTGTDWVIQASTLATGYSTYGMIHAFGKFHAAHSYNGIVSSADGISWSTLSAALGIRAICYDATHRRIYAPAYGTGVFYSSDDGVTWPTETMPAGAWVSVAASGSIIVATPGSGTTAAVKVGEAWQTATIPLTAPIYVAAGDGIFMAVGTNGIATSTDGLNWSATSTPTFTPQAITFGAHWFALVGTNAILMTQDGVTLLTSTQASTTYECVGYGLGRFTAPRNGGSGASRFSQFVAGTVVSPSAAPSVADIVTDICASATLAAGDIDVTDLSATVAGYAITRGTARSHLQQLMQTCFFDAVESDGKIKFVTRGGAAVATIAEDDLAAHEYGSAVPDALTTNRAQDLELPREVAINFPNVNAAYQVSTQLSPRLITSSENKISHNLAVVMTPTKGKQVADVLLYDAWTARSTLELATGWKYGYLEPTDVVTITNSGRSYTVRLVDETADGGIFRRSAVVEDADVYTQSAAAAESQTPDETLAPVPPTRLQLLDIPLLRDQDDGVGFYAAAAGNTDAWRGAQLFKSNDSGLTWAAYGNGFLNGATMGVALTALGNFTLNQFDEANRVSILLASGELASDTEINILNGANVALLGDEIIQFKTATLTATRTYLLSGLLRGRRGTEWARSTHAISDRFVLLTATTLYLLPAASAEYDLERTYRAVSFGSFLDDAEEIDFTHTAVALIPYAPVHLGGGRDASGNLTLTWIRRTRISGGWNNYADVPLGEDSQAYEVEIYSSATYATLKRTITGIGSATTSYTAAQQTTDFGAPQSTVYFIVYQVSATVGRGYEARGVI